MKNIFVVIVIFIVFPLMAAPRIDELRMNRDLEIAKSVLSTLIKTESETYFGEKMIEASYVEGYGVIFNIAKSMLYFMPRTFDINPVIIDMPSPDVDVFIEGDFEVNENIDEEALEEIKENAEEMRKEASKMQKEAEYFQKEAKEMQKLAKVERKEMIKHRTKDNLDWEKLMITFFADYADVIGQLKPEDRILINRESPNDNMVFFWNQEDAGGEKIEKQHLGMSAEVTKKDISSYRAGKLSLEEFKQRVILKKKESEKKIADLEMFGSILKRYYSPDLSETFFTDGSPRYELLEGFGVIYQIKTYSSYAEADYFQMPTTGRKNVNAIDRELAIEQLYPKFQKDIKNFILDYGRTIRSLNDNDQLMIRVKLTRCNGCNIPEYLELTIKMKDLRAFDRQKLSREKAIAAIELKEIAS